MPRETEETYFFPDNIIPDKMQDVMKSGADFEKVRVTLGEKEHHIIYGTNIKGAKFQKELLTNNENITRLFYYELNGDTFKEMNYRDFHKVIFPWIEGKKMLVFSYFKASPTSLEIAQFQTFDVAWEQLAQAEECNEDPMAMD